MEKSGNNGSEVVHAEKLPTGRLEHLSDGGGRFMPNMQPNAIVADTRSAVEEFPWSNAYLAGGIATGTAADAMRGPKESRILFPYSTSGRGGQEID